MKAITSSQYLSFLQSFGLSLTMTTGGNQPEFTRECRISKESGLHTLSVNNESPIIFLEPELFIHTIKATEASLHVQLFN